MCTNCARSVNNDANLLSALGRRVQHVRLRARAHAGTTSVLNGTLANGRDLGGNYMRGEKRIQKLMVLAPAFMPQVCLSVSFPEYRRAHGDKSSRCTREAKAGERGSEALISMVRATVEQHLVMLELILGRKSERSESRPTFNALECLLQLLQENVNEVSLGALPRQCKPRLL